MQAPDFSLPDQNDVTHTLADYHGKWLVLYFYPKDETPGCITEACTFRDGRDMLAELGAEIVGVSKDSVRSHAKFADHHGLNFTLLSDRTGATIKAYGSSRTLGTHRDTYLISPDGEIAKKYEGVDPATHFEDILADLQQLKAS